MQYHSGQLVKLTMLTKPAEQGGVPETHLAVIVGEQEGHAMLISRRARGQPWVLTCCPNWEETDETDESFLQEVHDECVRLVGTEKDPMLQVILQLSGRDKPNSAYFFPEFRVERTTSITKDRFSLTEEEIASS